jgi:transcriptional regulator with XRE-family HTH domain
MSKYEGQLSDRNVAMQFDASDPHSRKALGAEINSRRKRLGLTVEDLAIKARFDERTVGKALNGSPVRPKTIFQICKSVGLDLSEETDPDHRAADTYGSYSLRLFEKYSGSYEAFRWSYQDIRDILCSKFDVFWDKEKKCISFQESQKYNTKQGKTIDFSQSGCIHSSDESGLLHLLTVDQGSVRLITLLKMQPPDLCLRGCVLTQARTNLYRQPAISPILLRKRPHQANAEVASFSIGEMSQGDPGYGEIAAELREIEREVVRSTFAEMGDAERRRISQPVREMGLTTDNNLGVQPSVLSDEGRPLRN